MCTTGNSMGQGSRKEMFYLTTHLTHFIYGYMESDQDHVYDTMDPRGRQCNGALMTTIHRNKNYLWGTYSCWAPRQVPIGPMRQTTQIVREETLCRHTGYSFRLATRVLLYSPFHRHDSTYHGLCYTTHGALAGTKKSLSQWVHHEGSIRPFGLNFRVWGKEDVCFSHTEFTKFWFLYDCVGCR